VENLSERLNEIRKEKNRSVVEFAEELGISRSSLQSLLSGRGNPRIDTIEYIAQQLDVDALELLSPWGEEATQRQAQHLANVICSTARLTAVQRQELMASLLEISEMIG